MAFRGVDQFPFIVTSDGSADTYPENKTSSFRIFLKEPIDVGDEDWEVALHSINYPYSWTNVGPSAKVSMKYYLGGFSGAVHEVIFPDWQCQSMEEVIKFITKDMHLSQQMTADTKVWLRLDELRRFKMSAVVPSSFDVGFSDNMMRLLGLAGHRQSADMTLEAFERRQQHRNFLAQIWMKDRQPMDINDPQVRQNVLSCETLLDFAHIVTRYLQQDHLENIYDQVTLYEKEHPIFPSTRPRMFGRRDLNTVASSSADAVFEKDFAETKAGRVLRLAMFHMQSLFSEPELPKTIKGVIPGMMNPVQRMFVYINIIEPVDMNDKTIKLLKLVNTRGEPFKTTQEEYTHPMYFALEKGKISMIEVLIADEMGDPVSFQNGTVVLTLHFRRALQQRPQNIRRRF
jgi:hypothetical protein